MTSLYPRAATQRPSFFIEIERKELLTTIARIEGLCASIYLPVRRDFAALFDDAMSSIRLQLDDRGLGRVERMEFLQPLLDCAEPFKRNPGGAAGVAIFWSASSLMSVDLALPPLELMTVEHYPRVTALIGLWARATDGSDDEVAELERRAAVIERWAELPGVVGTRIGEVLRRSAEGRVESLFIDADAETLGDAHALLYNQHEASHPFEDLLNAAAVETLQHGGRVFVVPSRRMPIGGVVAAEYRC